MKPKDLESISETLSRVIKESLNRRFMMELGQQFVSDVKTRVRLGYGNRTSGGTRVRLKPLSAPYISFRRGQAVFYKDNSGRLRSFSKKSTRHPALSDETSPTKSNLTFTGQMLDSMRPVIIKDNEFGIEFTGVRKKIRQKEKALTNAEVAEFAKKDRPFINPTNREIDRLEQTINDKLRQEILKSLKALSKI